MLTTARRLRNDLKVFYITHSENIEDEGKIVGQKIKTIGKALDNQIVLEGLFTIALYTHVDEDKNSVPTYHFVTNRFRNYPAKSPMEMFPEVLIPNDLQLVCNLIDDYYNDVTPPPVTHTPNESSTPVTTSTSTPKIIEDPVESKPTQKAKANANATTSNQPTI